MPENRFPCTSPSLAGSRDRDMVCIETNRILDSCRDRDCFENVRVFLTDVGNEIIEHTSSVRVKDSCIAWAFVGIDPVRFNRGFYTVTIRFYIKLTFEACVCAGRSQEFDGIAVVEKNVVLYGGDSNVSVFRSNPDNNDFCAIPEPCCGTKNVPTAVVEVVDPIILGAKVVELKSDCCCHCCCCVDDLPDTITSHVNGVLVDGHDGERALVVSVGLFSVVRIVRPAQYLINATEYAVPDKECRPDENASPCSVFNSMPFPTHEFAPRDRAPHGTGCGGGSGRSCCGS